MKERPILFSGPMVRAILDGRKTQTRRIIKPVQPRTNGMWPAGRNPVPDCPFGANGDVLWVRETWAPVNGECGPGFAYKADGAFSQPEYDGKDYGAGPSFNYEKYPGEYTMWYADLLSGAPGHPWKPSIHCPRWASRITLEITEVRVERLQDISEDDAKAEGVERLDTERYAPDWDRSVCPQCGGTLLYTGLGANLGVMPDCDCLECDTYKKRFKHLWNHINGNAANEGDAWAENPWLWAISFRRVEEVAGTGLTGLTIKEERHVSATR